MVSHFTPSTDSLPHKKFLFWPVPPYSLGSGIIYFFSGFFKDSKPL